MAVLQELFLFQPRLQPATKPAPKSSRHERHYYFRSQRKSVLQMRPQDHRYYMRTVQNQLNSPTMQATKPYMSNRDVTTLISNHKSTLNPNTGRFDVRFTVYKMCASEIQNSKPYRAGNRIQKPTEAPAPPPVRAHCALYCRTHVRRSFLTECRLLKVPSTRPNFKPRAQWAPIRSPPIC